MNCLLCQHLPIGLRNTMWLQHDGAPAHYFLRARNYLDRTNYNWSFQQLLPWLIPHRTLIYYDIMKKD
ncbi:hypothetical protein NQ315_003282, partial [Exocentrus adspersus]